MHSTAIERSGGTIGNRKPREKRPAYAVRSSARYFRCARVDFFSLSWLLNRHSGGGRVSSKPRQQSQNDYEIAAVSCWRFSLSRERLACFLSCGESSAQTNSEDASKIKAPTGVYVSGTSLPANFIVSLQTNGEYEVRVESSRVLPRQVQRGKWYWDERRRESLLTPSTNSTGFHYEFRRLRVDPQEPGTLQWIPLRSGITTGGGAIDYIRFKRKTG